MKYPRPLTPGDSIGVCAPSLGLLGSKTLSKRLDQAIENVEDLGYKIIESASVRGGSKCVSADAPIRAAEFMALYENPEVAAIIPIWGGEFQMDMLPYLDFEGLEALTPTWLCGFSDISLLTFSLTTRCDISTIHGSALLNMGYSSIHESDLRAFDAMAQSTIVQQSAPLWGSYAPWGASNESYELDQKGEWKALDGTGECTFSGRMIGGCLDCLNTVIGTQFFDISTFLEKYADDGFIWTIESCEMNSSEIYRMLWKMREAGFLQHCKGIIYGRPDGYSEVQDFTLEDALEQGLGRLNLPVLYNADIGHIPPQMQIINGAFAHVEFKNGATRVTQEKRV